jgi:L-lactate dehydrogenase complex protein LldG
MLERDTILDTIRQSLKTAHLPEARASLPPRPQLEPQLDSGALADSFTREALALGVVVHHPESQAQAVELVLRVLHESGSDEVLTWGDDDLPLPHLNDYLRAEGFKPLDPILSADPAARQKKLAELGRAEAGVTGALAGLADTGTLVVKAGPARPRLASLLPAVHVALLPVRSLYPDMAAFFAAHPDAVRESSNLVLITGPSRTGDIELTLTVGVHGPKTVHVVLVP